MLLWWISCQPCHVKFLVCASVSATVSVDRILSQHAPVLCFHCLFFWVVCPFAWCVWCSSSLVWLSHCLLSIHHFLYFCMHPVPKAPNWHIMWHVCMLTHWICCLLVVYSSWGHNVSNLLGWGCALHVIRLLWWYIPSWLLWSCKICHYVLQSQFLLLSQVSIGCHHPSVLIQLTL